MIRTKFLPYGRRATVYASALLLLFFAAVVAWTPAAAVDEPAGAPNTPLVGNAAIAHLKASGQYDALEAAYTSAVPAFNQQAYLKVDNGGAGDDLGNAVAVDGDTAVVGAPQENGFTGAAYVFVRTGTNWTQQAYLKANNSEAGDRFGWAAAISGDTIVVGAFRESSAANTVDGDGNDNSAPEAGAAYVFVRTGANWSQQAYLKANNSGAGDHFGWAVAISGNTIVVGAYLESSAANTVDGDGSSNSALNAGAAYVFVRTGANWSQQAYLKANNSEAGDFFGSAVAVSGDTIVVSALYEDSVANTINGDGSDNSALNAGAAYVFVRTGTTWTQQAYLKANNNGTNDAFGFSVAISGDTIVVGARYEDSVANTINGDGSDNSALDAGAAYIFVRTGTTWTQQAYLKADNAGEDDQFGYAVAISGDKIVVGAPYEDSTANTINGDGSDNSALNAGAAYVFVRTGATWAEQAYLKADNADAGDFFGFSVAASGDTIVVGAPYEDSVANTIGGDGSDNSAPEAGAAYIFVPTAVAQLQVTVIGSGSVSSSPAGIDCGTTCTASFIAGTPVTLTATAGVTATFTGWSGACTGAGMCAVTMDAARQVTATFAVQGNPLTATLTSQYVGQYITYTLVVTNTGAAPQQIAIAGSLPADSDLVSSSGSFQPGGDFGTGFVTSNVPALGPGASSSLVWVVKMRDVVGDIVSSATVSNETLNLQFEATNKIYRVFLMKLFKEGNLTQ